MLCQLILKVSVTQQKTHVLSQTLNCLTALLLVDVERAAVALK